MTIPETVKLSYNHEKALERLRARCGTSGKVISVDSSNQAKIPDPQPIVVETGYKTSTIDRKYTEPTQAQIDEWEVEHQRMITNGDSPF